jgi:hypothetical protein
MSKDILFEMRVNASDPKERFMNACCLCKRRCMATTGAAR